MMAAQAGQTAAKALERLRDAMQRLQSEKELTDLCNQILERSGDPVLNNKASLILERLRREVPTNDQ